LYILSNVIRGIKSMGIRWAVHVARKGELKNAYNMLVRKPEGNIPLERPMRRQENNIRMDLRQIDWVHGEWMHLSQTRD
jgi:hypothetical protein